MRNKMLFLVGAMVILSATSISAPSQADAKTLPFKNTWNQNIFTGSVTNWRSYTQVVPEHYYVRYTTTDSFAGGWNYRKYITFFHVY